MATITDVARVAGVSITTVSHVINGTRFVRDELKERVLDAMRELNYRPNSLARGLRKGQTKTIGLIVPDNSNLFFAEIARSIEDVGFSNGYSVILCNSDNNLEKQRTYIEALLAKKVDGVIFISAGDSGDGLQELIDAGIPIVVADREVSQTLADVVLVDNEHGGYIATKHLIDLGHRRIACIAGPSDLTPSAQRVDGYRRALAEADLPLESEYVAGGDFGIQSGEAAMAELLALEKMPTAVFVCNDMMAIGAIRAVRDRGLGVPEDISIIGFDDIPLAPATFPALSTVAQPKLEIARVATELLIQRMQSQDAGAERQRIVLEPELVVRNSSCQRSSS